MSENLKAFYTSLDQAYANGDKDDVEKLLLTQANDSCTSCDQFSEINLASISELGAFYRGVSKYETSIRYFESAADIIRRFLGEDSVEYATNINNLAGTYRLMGNYEKALELFLSAGKIYLKTVGESHYLYACVLNNISLVYQDLRDFPQAVRYLLHSLELIKIIPDSAEELATGYSNLSSLYQQMGEYEKSYEALKKALKVISKQSPHYPAVLNNLAALQFKNREYEKAKDTYLNVFENVQNFFGKSAEYAIACENLSSVYSRLDQPAKSLFYLTEARNTFEMVYGRNHERFLRVDNEIKRREENLKK